MSISFQDYQVFVNGRKMYNKDQNPVVYPSMGLSGEAGEVINKVKKVVRGDYPMEEIKEALLYELGDVLWYLTATTSDLGYTLEEVAQANVEKLVDRDRRGTTRGDGDDR